MWGGGGDKVTNRKCKCVCVRGGGGREGGGVGGGGWGGGGGWVGGWGGGGDLNRDSICGVPGATVSYITASMSPLVNNHQHLAYPSLHITNALTSDAVTRA